ncbi:response regulator [Salidesulfovibrio onnuriiensis]|uniref:response regulator n=1 Tax=Salidesulfovibrio onnuriiensis TaxID=2583823 RepID=UPI0011C7CEBD|nr:response regulator [Salidesulfovibrio onnuriiensis]
MSKKKFLIVDDDERFALLASSKLEKYAKCYMASNGEEALLFFQHHAQEGAPFSAVFMDIEMPDMSGHEAVQQMRALEKEMGTAPQAEFKLVMLTAHSDVKNVSVSFFKDQADAFVPKEKFKDNLIPELKKAKIIN